MNLLHNVSCFYSPKARRIASSSSNVILGGRTIFFFLRFSKALLTPYLAPVLTALVARALPAIKIRGMMPPRWRVRRRSRRLPRVMMFFFLNNQGRCLFFFYILPLARARAWLLRLPCGGVHELENSVVVWCMGDRLNRFIASLPLVGYEMLKSSFSCSKWVRSSGLSVKWVCKGGNGGAKGELTPARDRVEVLMRVDNSVCCPPSLCRR